MRYYATPNGDDLYTAAVWAYLPCYLFRYVNLCSPETSGASHLKIVVGVSTAHAPAPSRLPVAKPGISPVLPLSRLSVETEPAGRTIGFVISSLGIARGGGRGASASASGSKPDGTQRHPRRGVDAPAHAAVTPRSRAGVIPRGIRSRNAKGRWRLQTRAGH